MDNRKWLEGFAVAVKPPAGFQYAERCYARPVEMRSVETQEVTSYGIGVFAAGTKRLLTIAGYFAGPLDAATWKAATLSLDVLDGPPEIGQ